MRREIDEALRRHGGVATRPELLRVVSIGQFDDELRRGHLVAPYLRAYCRPWDAEDSELLDRAALRSVGMPAALSNPTALRRWGLPVPPAPRHVCIPHQRRVRARDGIVLHRVVRVPPMTRVRGLPTVLPAPALVATWPLLSAADRRAPVIAAVRQRIVTVDAVRAEVDRCRRLSGREELITLLGLLGDGCESELEIWGLLGVFDVPGLRHGVRQYRIRAGGRNWRLDLAYLAEQVAVELDGDRWHSTGEQRERDRRRDAALAAVGWLTLRLSWSRLHTDVEGCRRETLATLRARHTVEQSRDK